VKGGHGNVPLVLAYPQVLYSTRVWRADTHVFAGPENLNEVGAKKCKSEIVMVCTRTIDTIIHDDALTISVL